MGSCYSNLRVPSYTLAESCPEQRFSSGYTYTFTYIYIHMGVVLKVLVKKGPLGIHFLKGGS